MLSTLPVSRILCQGRKTVPVPGEPKVPILSGPGSRQPISEPPMQAHAQRRPADDGKRDIVTWHIDARESIALFEVTQAAALFLPDKQKLAYTRCEIPRSAHDWTACAINAFVGALSRC